MVAMFLGFSGLPIISISCIAVPASPASKNEDRAILTEFCIGVYLWLQIHVPICMPIWAHVRRGAWIEELVQKWLPILFGSIGIWSGCMAWVWTSNQFHAIHDWSWWWSDASCIRLWFDSFLFCFEPAPINPPVHLQWWRALKCKLCQPRVSGPMNVNKVIVLPAFEKSLLTWHSFIGLKAGQLCLIPWLLLLFS